MNKESRTVKVLQVNEFALEVADYGSPYILYDLDGEHNLKDFLIGDVLVVKFYEYLLPNGNKSKRILHIAKSSSRA